MTDNDTTPSPFVQGFDRYVAWMPSEPLTAEEQVIRDWLDGQLSPSGSPLPRSRRRSQPLPRRQVTAVIATLIDLLDEARAGARVGPDEVLRGRTEAALRATYDGSEGEGWRLVLMSEDGGVVPTALPDEFVTAFYAALEGSAE